MDWTERQGLCDVVYLIYNAIWNDENIWNNLTLSPFPYSI